jgi:predicted esterase
MRVLFLHGYGGAMELVDISTQELRKSLPGSQVDVLPGWIKIHTEAQLACLEGHKANASLLRAARAGLFELFAYATYDEVTDRMRKADMDAAVDRLANHISTASGFDVVCGFSQGGEVVANLLRRLPQLNEQLSTPVRVIGIFSTRTHHTFGDHIGGPPAVRFGANELSAFICCGEQDDFDKEDANAGNLDDMEAIARMIQVTGADCVTMHHRGGHEMPKADDAAMAAFAALISTKVVSNSGCLDAVSRCCLSFCHADTGARSNSKRAASTDLM